VDLSVDSGDAMGGASFSVPRIGPEGAEVIVHCVTLLISVDFDRPLADAILSTAHFCGLLLLL
jgi:hypothetical protein